MIAHIMLATQTCASRWRSLKKALGWHPIAQPNNINAVAAWLQIAPGVELNLIEVPEFEPSPFEREFGRHVAVTFRLCRNCWIARSLAGSGGRALRADT
jgi:hypothetical protein